MKRHLRLLYNAAIRLQPRHETPYATHMPILVGLGLLCRPRKVIEFGSGEFSTALFLDRPVFPTVEEVVSFENDAVWFSQVSSRLGGDARLHMQSISGEMASVISTSTLSGDLIFIDDESSAVLRSHTVVAVARGCPDGVPVVIHDAEQWRLRRAIRNFDHHFCITAMNPQTTIAWNGDLPFAVVIPTLAGIVRDNAAHLPPHDGQGWRRVVSETI
jgi:hypothetical protein